MNIIENYKKSLQAIYDHIGFEEDWVVYPIDDRTQMYWKLTFGNQSVFFCGREKHYNKGRRRKTLL